MRWTAIGLALAVMVPGGARAADQVYACHRYTTQVAAPAGALSLDKVFNEDGSVYRMAVRWEDGLGAAIGKADPADRAMVQLDWPGSHRVGDDHAPFDWGDGSVQVYYFPSAPNPFLRRKNEPWSQVIVDRNHALRVYQDKTLGTVLMPNWLGTTLESPTGSIAGPGRLWMSLDALIAWGTGASSVTVYETAVSRRRRASRDDTPYGARRVLAAYEVDTAALARISGIVRTETTAWEATLTDFRKTCQRQDSPKGEIIVN